MLLEKVLKKVIDEQENDDLNIKQKYLNYIWILVNSEKGPTPAMIREFKKQFLKGRGMVEASSWKKDDEYTSIMTIREWKRKIAIRRNKKDGKFALVSVWDEIDKSFSNLNDVDDTYRPSINFDMLVYVDEAARKFYQDQK